MLLIIAYKYKLYRTDRTKHLDRMLRKACFVWNHALALQKRYYRLYGKYINTNRMQKHFAKRISRNLSKCVPGSHNRERKRLDLDRHHEKVVNQRNAFQWQLMISRLQS